MTEQIPVPESGEVRLPNGCTLYWKTDPAVNCREYFSDEIGGGVFVWNTATVDDGTLLAAIANEMGLRHLEAVNASRIRRELTQPLKLDFSVDGGELLRDAKGIPTARPATSEEIELYALVQRLHGDLMWARAAAQKSKP